MPKKDSENFDLAPKKETDVSDTHLTGQKSCSRSNSNDRTFFQVNDHSSSACDFSDVEEDDDDDEQDMHFRRKKLCTEKQKMTTNESPKASLNITDTIHINLSSNSQENTARPSITKEYVNIPLNINTGNIFPRVIPNVNLRLSQPPPPPPPKLSGSLYTVNSSIEFPKVQPLYPFNPYCYLPTGFINRNLPPPPPVLLNPTSALLEENLNAFFNQKSVSTEQHYKAVISTDNRKVEQQRVIKDKLTGKNDKVDSIKKKTVYLFNLPEASNTMDYLSTVFKKFGTVVDLHIDFHNSPSRVKYSNEDDASKAIRIASKLKTSLFNSSEVVISDQPSITHNFQSIPSGDNTKSKLSIQEIQEKLTGKLRQIIQESKKDANKERIKSQISKVKGLISDLRKNVQIEMCRDQLKEFGIFV